MCMLFKKYYLYIIIKIISVLCSFYFISITLYINNIIYMYIYIYIYNVYNEYIYYTYIVNCIAKHY